MPIPSLQRDKGNLPLDLTAGKSANGHAEVGAGVLGMLHASMQLARQAANGITHLRAPNAYVTSTLDAVRANVFLPRAAGPHMVAGMPEESVWHMSISSFAFQVRSAYVPYVLHYRALSFLMA
jgi:acyl transferase domain-containing protein